MRAGVFFSVNARLGWKLGLAAVLHDVWFRIPLSGIIGALTEAFRSAQPAWLATLTVSLLLPALAHLVEFAVHTLTGTADVRRSIIASLSVTLLSILFNYYVMRQGVLVVSGERQSLWKDLQQMPRLVLGFLLILPKALLKTLGWGRP